MAGFLDKFRQSVFHSVWKDQPARESSVNIDDKIALGVLLWVVAEADKRFLTEEREQVRKILQERGGISPQDMSYIMHSIEIAARERIDLFTFTSEVKQDLPYSVKKDIIECLFRVACADGELAHEEHEIIRKISGLCGVDHKDFIEAKLKIKKEFGLDTAG